MGTGRMPVLLDCPGREEPAGKKQAVNVPSGARSPIPIDRIMMPIDERRRI
jgi:hypothetical protein